jgi:predicted nucleic acid-binding Zn ribbon protein
MKETLDCQNCGKALPVEEMYSVDACSESCQNIILALQKFTENVKASINIARHWMLETSDQAEIKREVVATYLNMIERSLRRSSAV